MSSCGRSWLVARAVARARAPPGARAVSGAGPGKREPSPSRLNAAQNEMTRRLGELRDERQRHAAPLARQQHPTEVERRLFLRLLSYLPGYEAALNLAHLPKKFLAASRLLIGGSRRLFSDMKRFQRAHHSIRLAVLPREWELACRGVSMRDLEVYDALPGALKRVGPVLLLSALPMAQYAVFPVAMAYPERLLSEHFWTEEQRAHVERQAVLRRHAYYRPLFRDMQYALGKMRGRRGHATGARVFAAVGKGEQPLTDDLAALLPLFEPGAALHLGQINSLHVRNLMRAHGRAEWLRLRIRLRQYANLLRQMDLALLREGTPLANLGDRELYSAAARRGLNTAGLDRQEVEEYLGAWCEVSRRLGDASEAAALLLHLPVLIGYNHRSRGWDEKSVL